MSNCDTILDAVLESVNLRQFKDIFAENGISDDILPDLTIDDIKELMPRLGDRIKFVRECKRISNPTVIPEQGIFENENPVPKKTPETTFVFPQLPSTSTGSNVKNCFLCLKTSSTISLLRNHLKECHGIDKFFKSFKCCGCSSLFDNQDHYFRHLRYHCQKSIKATSQTIVEKVNQPVNKEIFPNIEFNYEASESSSEQNIYTELAQSINTLFQRLIVQILCNNRIPHTSISGILKGFSEIIKIIDQQIVKTLAGDSYVLIKPCFEIFNQNFSPQFLKQNAFQNHNIIKPVECILQTRCAPSSISNQQTALQKLTHDTMQYISLKKNMENMLNDINFMKAYKKHIKDINTKFSKNPEVLLDYRTGARHLKSNFEENVIYITLYVDDVETCNAIGPRAVKHKLTMLYFTVKDLPNYLSSKLEYIKLVAVIKTVDLKQYGYDCCLRLLLSDLKYLESNSLRCNIKDYEGDYTVQISQIVGDNLGLHSILGFSESFSCNYPCRFCKMSKETCRNACVSNEDLSRTRNNYQKDLEKNCLGETGIKNACMFNELCSFHVTENYAVDIMHDILEGVARYDLTVVLNHLISNKLISIDDINYRLDSYDYCRIHRKNKPPKLKSSNVPNISASQMFCFVQILPTLLGEFVEEGDECWELLLILNDLIDHVMSPTMSKSGINHLKILIEYHNSLYLKVSGESLKPKFHHLIHYPEMMLQIGPLKQFWVMRFEAKHRVAKNITNNICNFRNICYSVAERFQIGTNICYNKEAYKDTKSYSNLETVSINDVTESNDIREAMKQISGCDFIYCCKSVDINGTEYFIGEVILLEWGENLPTFGRVKQIFVNENVIYAVINPFKTVVYHNHTHSYIIENTESELILNLCELQIPTTLLIGKMNESIDDSVTAEKSNVSQKSTEETLSNFTGSPRNEKYFDIKHILSVFDPNNSPQLWNDVQEKRMMTVFQKFKIATFAAQQLIKDYGDYPSSQKKMLMASSLTQAFPFVSKSTWYFHEAGCNASGCLENKINTLRRNKIKINGPLTVVKKKRQNILPIIDNEPAMSNDDFLAKKKWLQNFRFPEHQVFFYLEETFEMRRKEIMAGSGEYSISLEWPVLFRSADIVSFEYNLLPIAVGSGQRLYVKWPNISQKILGYCSQSSINVHDKLKLIQDLILQDSEMNTAAAMMIPYIINNGHSMIGKKRRKISNVESLSYFLQFYPDGTNVQKLCDSEFKRTQPFIVIIGTESSLRITQCFVMVERKIIECTSVIQCIDICFKIYFILNLNFPTEVAYLWNFFANYIYEVKETVTVPNVQHFISSLESISI